MTDQPRDFTVGDYVWHNPIGAAPTSHRRAGQVRGFVQCDRIAVWVRWLDEDPRRTHPVERAELVYATPNPADSPIEDATGRPLPQHLQPGGQIWLAVADGLHTGVPASPAQVDAVMIALARFIPTDPDTAAGPNNGDSNTATAGDAADPAFRCTYCHRPHAANEGWCPGGNQPVGAPVRNGPGR